MTQSTPAPMTTPRRYWPKDKPRSLPLPNVSVMHNLRVTTQRYPDKTAVWFYGRSLSYRELLEQAEHLAGHLSTQGIKKGDRVVVWMQNSPVWMVAAYAIWHLGGVLVPLPPMLQAKELAFYVQDAGVKVGVVSSELYGKAKEAGLSHVVVANIMQGTDPIAAGIPIPADLNKEVSVGAGDISFDEALQAPPAPAAQVDGNDLCVLAYTSGTTGLPKGCMHTHRNAQANIFGSSVWGNAYSTDVFLAVMPYFHVTGLVNSMLTPALDGGTIVLMARWNRDAVRELIKNHRATAWANTPTMVIDMLASPHFVACDLSTLRDIGGGGASLPLAVGQRLLDLTGHHYYEGYGLTETMAQTHSVPKDYLKLQCLGIPLFDVDSRIIDLDTLREVPVGEVGEIVTHGPQVMQGYWQRPEETEQAFVTLDGKKFLRTGDLGYMDEDGFFYFADRVKRMINVSGMKVWPAEVESKLHAHPAVQEACVIAVSDGRSGEKARALIVLRPGQTVSAAELESWAREQMSNYKVPRDYQFVESLPHGATGKVIWRQLQEQAQREARAASES